MPDTWQIIENRLSVLNQSFYKQIDKTRKRLNLTPFELTDPLASPDGSHSKVSDAVNVTENQSANYMSRIIAGLMSAKWQTVVQGQISPKEAHKIEKFLEDNRQQADEYLLNEYGLTGLDAWLCNHVCHTSLIGVEWLSSIENNEYKIHCLPLDMRWTPFILNKWAAPITYRSKEDLLKELEDYKKMAVDDGTGTYEFVDLKENVLKDTDNEVRDYWDSKVNELWIEKQRVFTQPNTYGKLPFVFVWPPSGFMFRDKGYLENESPGILFLNENLYDQLSRQLTIDATLGYNSLAPAMEYESENLKGGQARPAPRRGESLGVPKGELHKPIPTADINRAQLTTRDEVARLVDEAAPLSPKSYNTPPSAIEIATEVELLNELQNPRIIALQMFKEQLARLIIDQFIFLNGKGDIGRRGNRQNFTVADLKDPGKYTISYQMMKQNKRLAIVNEARALALWGKAPMKYILRDVFSVEDPEGWAREMELEKAKAANPAIGLAEMAVRYAEEAEDLDDSEKDLKNWQSMMLVHDYVMLMRSRLQPALPAETENLREATKETGNAGGVIKMLGQGGGALPKLPQGQGAIQGVTQ